MQPRGHKSIVETKIPPEGIQTSRTDNRIKPNHLELPESSPVRKRLIREIYEKDPQIALKITYGNIEHVCQLIAQRQFSPDLQKEFEDCLKLLKSYIKNPRLGFSNAMEAFQYSLLRQSETSENFYYYAYLRSSDLIGLLLIDTATISKNFNYSSATYVENLDNIHKVAIQVTALAHLAQRHRDQKVPIETTYKELFNMLSAEDIKATRQERSWQISQLRAIATNLRLSSQQLTIGKRGRKSPLAD